MSKQAIHQYYNRLDQYKRFGGTRTVRVKTMEIVHAMAAAQDENPDRVELTGLN
jgi:hypothetical protein